MSNKDKLVSIKITEEELEALKKIADSDARSVSSTVRLLVIKLIKGDITITSNVK